MIMRTTRFPLFILLAIVVLGGCASTPQASPGEAPSPRAMTFLLFQDGRAEEAMRFYVDTLPGSRIVEIDRYGTDEAGVEGSMEFGAIEVGDLRIAFTDSPMTHAFDFTPSISFYLECGSGEDVDQLAAELSRDGKTLMAPGAYGFAERFAWVEDRYGVSWQLVLNRR